MKPHLNEVCMDMYNFVPARSLGEECDDGDLLSGDGCSRACELEEGFHCVGEFRHSCLQFCFIFCTGLRTLFCKFLISCHESFIDESSHHIAFDVFNILLFHICHLTSFRICYLTLSL